MVQSYKQATITSQVSQEQQHTAQKLIKERNGASFDESDLGLFNCDNIDSNTGIKRVLEGLNCAAAIIEDDLLFETNPD